MALSEGQNLTLNFDFRGRISTFRAENAPKIGHFKAENNAQTTSEQLQKHLPKSLKNDFFGPKNGQNGPLRGPIFDTKL